MARTKRFGQKGNAATIGEKYNSSFIDDLHTISMVTVSALVYANAAAACTGSHEAPIGGSANGRAG